MKNITIEELTKYNQRFLSEHYEIYETDEKMANRWIEIIEKTRDEKQPKNGDILRLTTKHGDFYRYAHIDKINDDGTAEICQNAYIPFIGRYDENKNDITLSTSGGAWCSVPVKDLKYIKKEKKIFQDWGHCGACANGTIEFSVIVNVWEYKEPNALYDDYTTEFYDKQYIYFLTDEQKEQRQTNYKILGDSKAWETFEEYEAYKKLYNGKEFKNDYNNNCVLFTYKEKRIYNVDALEFNNLKLKKYIILDNGAKYIAKVARDDEQKQIFIYLCNDYKIEFENIEQWRSYKRYSEYKEV